VSIGLITHAKISNSGGSPASVTSSAFNSTGANLLIVAIDWLQTTAPTLTDSNSNTWTPLTVRTNTTRFSLQFFYAKNPTVGSGHTFTVNRSGGWYGCGMLSAWSGADTTSPFDQQNGTATATGDTGLSTGSVTPGSPNELVITAFGLDDPGGNTVGVSGGAGFTQIDFTDVSPGALFGLATAYQIQTTATAVNPAWTRSTTNTQSGDLGVVATFKAAATSFIAPQGTLLNQSVKRASYF